ncbi:Uncharacterized protein APZ42_027950 [Daphnia magna]|uniref:RNase H type-1 domain-containing protein n=1 Tax=Daphnia magna TaxID=35525 RepID=A0A164QXH1_9CRUS|nr:Uncharacterized protein APZ42_027950 [Daphnia magna]
MSSSESDSRQGSSRDGTIHGRRKGREVSMGRETFESVVSEHEESTTPVLPLDPLLQPHGDWLENPQKRQKLDDGIYRFGISKRKGKKFFKWMGKALEDSEGKEIKARYSPTFEKKSAKLQCPSLDDCLYQRLMLIKGSSASKSSIDSNERSLYKLQQKVLEVTKPLLFLANERVEKESHHEAIRDALQLLDSYLRKGTPRLLFSVMEFLGLEVDSQAVSLSLPTSKRAAIIALWPPFPSLSLRLMCGGSSISISPGSNPREGQIIGKQAPTLVIFSDASLSGLGAVCNGVRTGGPWTADESNAHINILELQAAYFSLQSYADLSRNCLIVLKMDNSTAVYYINKLGVSKCLALCKIALLIAA